MKAPGFWFRPPGLASLALSPLAAIWTIAARRRQRSSGEGVGVPVVCIGNVTVGGSGKTPTVIALQEALHDASVHVVTRGYKGSLDGPVRVDPLRHRSSQVGDEPLLLSAFGPVWVAKDRLEGARAAAKAGARLILLDDGHQNPHLAKDLSIVVVDAATRFGNGRVMPAGPLREPVTDGLARADCVLAIGTPDARTELLQSLPYSGPVVQARIEPLQTGMDWQGARVLAFAGIGHPQKFFDTLNGLGANVVATHAFGDHEPYREDRLDRLQAEARKLGAQLVTTEKDAARLPVSFRAQVLALPVRLRFADDAGLMDRVRSLMG